MNTKITQLFLNEGSTIHAIMPFVARGVASHNYSKQKHEMLKKIQ